MSPTPSLDSNVLGPNANPSDPGRGPMIIGILWALTIIASSAVAARLYVRKKIGALGWDDWLMLLALVFQLIDIGFITKAYSFGLGKHDKDLTFNQLINALKWGWLWMIPGTFVAVLARVSSAIFLNRLFGVRAWFKWYLIIFTTLQCFGGITVLLVNFTGVSPVEALWNPTVTGTRVKPEIALDSAYLAQAIFTFADLTYVLFPVIIIWRLHMTLSRRFALILLMCTSFVTMTASIIKILTLQTTAADLTEPQYSSSLAALWSGVEQTLVIIMASVPVLSAASQIKFPVFSRLGSSLASRFGRHSSKKSSTASSSRYYRDLELSDKLNYQSTVSHHNA